MTPLLYLALGLAGGAGAIARFLLDGTVSARVGRDFPHGTLAVNLLGSVALGALFGAALSAGAYRVWATGLIGAFTTFSTWAFESHRLGEDGELGLSALNFAVSLACGVLAAWLGRRIGMAL
jgi:CrcB protein